MLTMNKILKCLILHHSDNHISPNLLVCSAVDYPEVYIMLAENVSPCAMFHVSIRDRHWLYEYISCCLHRLDSDCLMHLFMLISSFSRIR